MPELEAPEGFDGSVLRRRRVLSALQCSVLVEVMDPGSFGTGSTIYCGGFEAAQGTGLVMLLTEAPMMPDHPCAPWLPLVSAPSNDYYWPGCTPGDCPDPPSAEAGTDASAEGGNVETDGAAATEAGLATDAARSP